MPSIFVATDIEKDRSLKDVVLPTLDRLGFSHRLVFPLKKVIEDLKQGSPTACSGV